MSKGKRVNVYLKEDDADLIKASGLSPSQLIKDQLDILKKCNLEPAEDDVLLPNEKTALGLTAALANALSAVIYHPWKELRDLVNMLQENGQHGDAIRAAAPLEGMKAAADNDWAEAAADIHRIQHTIMAQAAARAYPNHLRLLGDIGDWRKV